MKYQLKLDKQELTLLKAAVQKYTEQQKDRMYMALLNNNLNDFDLAKDLESKLILLGGRLQNIIPVAKKITKEN